MASPLPDTRAPNTPEAAPSIAPRHVGSSPVPAPALCLGRRRRGRERISFGRPAGRGMVLPEQEGERAAYRHYEPSAKATIRSMEPLRGHQRVDRRSLEMHRAIAEKLRAHPELLEIALEN